MHISLYFNASTLQIWRPIHNLHLSPLLIRIISVCTYSLDSICKACVLFTQSRQLKYSSSWREGRNKEAEATYYWAAYFYIRELSFPSKRTWCIEFEYKKFKRNLEMSPKLFWGMISEGFGNDFPPHIYFSLYSNKEK